VPAAVALVAGVWAGAWSVEGERPALALAALGAGGLAWLSRDAR
jgi:hypothetical protein